MENLFVKEAEVDLIEEEKIDIACELGKTMLKFGGETYRVEEIITRTLSYYGIKGSSFAVLNTIIISVEYSNMKKEAKVIRVSGRNINLNKVDKINDIARNLKNYSTKEIKQKLEEINNSNEINTTRKFLGNILVGGAFAILFSGNLNDSLVAAISSIFLGVMDKLYTKIKINSFFTNFLGGAIATLNSLIFYKVGVIEDISISIISALMLLVPGISFTNSIRDIMAEDFVSGVSRIVEAIVVGIALAAGSGVILSILYI